VSVDVAVVEWVVVPEDVKEMLALELCVDESERVAVDVCVVEGVDAHLPHLLGHSS